MRTGDGAYIKLLNRSLILQQIIKKGKISRADLSKTTGLNKATVSVQVADLLEQELIYESRVEHNAIGRRPIMLSINSSAGYILGIDLDTPLIQFAISNLSGEIVEKSVLEIGTDEYEAIVQLLNEQIRYYIAKYSDSIYGLISVNIAIHGPVDNGVIGFIPKLEWENKNLKNDLTDQLDIELTIENNANLSAFAEQVYNHQSDNLLALILTSGIGTGIILDDKLHKGYSGHAGEVGHMIIEPGGRECSCGNSGCWERYASDSSFLRESAKLLNISSLSIADVKDLVNQNDDNIDECFEKLFRHLATGLNNIINLYNPETIVLTSEILPLYPNAVEKIEEHLTSTMIDYREIVLSGLGNKSAVMGACALGIKRFFDISELTLLHEADTSNDHQIREKVNI